MITRTKIKPNKISWTEGAESKHNSSAADEQHDQSPPPNSSRRRLVLLKVRLSLLLWSPCYAVPSVLLLDLLPNFNVFDIREHLNLDPDFGVLF